MLSKFQCIVLIVKDSFYLSCVASHLNELSSYYLHHFSHLEMNVCEKISA